MSGQHYLPQFLQRPFSFRTTGKDFYVRAYEKHHAFSPNTKGIGTEREFYGTLADENISAAERDLAPLVEILAASDQGEGSQGDYALLVSCISLRTKAMRGALQSLAPMMIAACRSLAEQKDFARKQLEEVLSGANIDKLVSDELRKRAHLNREQRATLNRRVSEFKRNQAAMYDQVSSQARAFMRNGLEQLETEAESVADRAFIKALEESANPVKRLALFQEFSYRMLHAPNDEYFILGDCGVVAVQTDGKPKLALGDIDETVEIESVFLPVTPSRCIVGERKGRIELGTQEINVLSASLSTRFFISSSVETEHIKHLQSLIGSATPLITMEELDSLMESIEVD